MRRLSGSVEPSLLQGDSSMIFSTIGFHVTDRCQLNCEHCLRDPEQKGVDLSLEHARAVLEEAKEAFGSHHISLTGGEPTIYRDFYRLIDVAVELGYTWHMQTNAERFPRVVERLSEDPRRMEAFEQVNFSLDGATEQTHDLIRGRGSFQAVMAGIEVAQRHGISQSLQMAVNGRNLHECEALCWLAAARGVPEVSLEVTQPTGTYLDPLLYAPVDAFKELRARLFDLASTLNVQIRVFDGFPQPSPLHLCQSFSGDTLYVKPDGAYNICCRHAGTPGDGDRSTVGRVGETPLADVHARIVAFGAEVQRAHLDASLAELDDPWDASPCNFCLGHCGLPHWRSDGVSAGARARRERWRGAWAPPEEKVEEAARAREALDAEGA